MGLFGSDSSASQAYDTYNSTPKKHEGNLTHELLGGAAAYEAAKAYEAHVAKNGKPDSHAKAKEIAAGLIGAFVEKEVETHGASYIDKARAKREAQKHVDEVITVDQY
jgi:hypothetical protein